MAMQIKDGKIVHIDPPAQLSEVTKEKLRSNPLAAQALKRAQGLKKLPHRVDTSPSRQTPSRKAK